MSRLQAAVFQVLGGFTLSDDVRKILETAYYADDSFTQGRAAGLEEAATLTEEWGVIQECADAIRALITSTTSSDAGKDDPILATWPAEIWLQAGDEPLGHYSEYEDVTWCRIPQGESDVRYVRASSLEVIGKGEKG